MTRSVKDKEDYSDTEIKQLANNLYNRMFRMSDCKKCHQTGPNVTSVTEILLVPKQILFPLTLTGRSNLYNIQYVRG